MRADPLRAPPARSHGHAERPARRPPRRRPDCAVAATSTCPPECAHSAPESLATPAASADVSALCPDGCGCSNAGQPRGVPEAGLSLVTCGDGRRRARPDRSRVVLLRYLILDRLLLWLRLLRRATLSEDMGGASCATRSRYTAEPTRGLARPGRAEPCSPRWSDAFPRCRAVIAWSPATTAVPPPPGDHVRAYPRTPAAAVLRSSRPTRTPIEQTRPHSPPTASTTTVGGHIEPDDFSRRAPISMPEILTVGGIRRRPEQGRRTTNTTRSLAPQRADHACALRRDLAGPAAAASRMG